MQREKDLHSFVRTPQSVSPSFPILLLDVYIHILEKIRNTLEWSFTSNTLCIPAIIFSFLYNASWLSIGSFLCIFSFTNTIGETKQKKSPKRKWTKTVIQSLCRCYWQFQLRNYLYRQALIWNREQTVISESPVFSMFWVRELYKTAEANGVNMWSATPTGLFRVSFFCTTLTATIWVGLQKTLKQSSIYHANSWPQKQAISSCTNHKQLLPVIGSYR